MTAPGTTAPAMTSPAMRDGAAGPPALRVPGSRAEERWVIAIRSWPDPIPETMAKPAFRPVSTARMSLAEAEDQRAAGLVETPTGRERVLVAGKPHIVEKLYCVPKRRGARLRLAGRVS